MASWKKVIVSGSNISALNNDANYIGISFLIKNSLILAIVFGYIYFYRKINQTKVSIKETKETIIKENKTDDKEKVSSLDQFLEDDEIDR